MHSDSAVQEGCENNNEDLVSRLLHKYSSGSTSGNELVASIMSGARGSISSYNGRRRWAESAFSTYL